MRNFNIIIIILSMFSGSCECGRKRIDRKYIIENHTGNKLKIDVYQFGLFRYSKERNGKGVLHEEIGSNRGKGGTILVYDALTADSVIIYFNDSKRITYYKANSFPVFRGIPNNRKNILNDSSYTHESNTLYRYTFTEEDYNNAEDL